MQGPELTPKAARRLVQEIVLTYTLEGDATQTPHTLTLRRTPGAAGSDVNGVVWSAELMERLGYIDAQPGNGRCTPVNRRPGKPEDGWERKGGGRPAGASAEGTETSTATMSAMGGDCIWLHEVNCNWISYCSPGDDT